MELSSLLMVVLSSTILAISSAASVGETSQLGSSIKALKGYLKSAEESSLDDGDGYYTADVLPPIYISKTIDEDDEDDKRGTMFRFGKRGSIFRFGKRGNIFRYGRPDGKPFNDGLEQGGHYYQVDDKRAIFRYGKRKARLHAPFRFGKDLETGESNQK